MSKLTGHSRITKQAVRELKLPQNSFASSHLRTLSSEVVGRDLRDVAGGHWADFGQKHHFMRRFNGQSEFDAYIESVNWVKSNAIKSARSIRAGKLMAETPHSRGKVNWITNLGYACHALQDSFSQSHTHREDYHNENAPGRIIRVLRFSGADAKGHAAHDHAWRIKKTDVFSTRGRAATNATRRLIQLVLTTAEKANNESIIPTKIDNWNSFVNTWLAHSPMLSRARDDVFDIIDSHYAGIRLGNSNLKTTNMAEKNWRMRWFKNLVLTVANYSKFLQD